MYTITVNDNKIKANPGDTILKVLKNEGIKIPTLCHIDGLTPTGACRVCVVELVDQNRLAPSCSLQVYDNMIIKTHSQRAINARKTIIELLLSNHPDDCLYCVRQGNCELSNLAIEYGIRQKRKNSSSFDKKLDISSPSIIREENKCILCGKCVRVCEEVQGVSAIDFINRGHKAKITCAFNENINISSCVNCGQCVLVCPTGALSEKDNTNDVIEALNDKDQIVIAQYAPSVPITIAEEFGFKPGIDATGLLNNALKKLGFNYVFDTSFTADLTIMEEASELVNRISNNGHLPMLTSCSPGWIKFIEQFYPEMIKNISTCKSPQQMLGSIIKTYFAKKNNIEPSKIYSVSIMPCTAKKFEAQRPEHLVNGLAAVDTVLTTREISKLLKLHSIDFKKINPSETDIPFGTRSSAGKLFGVTGGVMEAALRTVYFLITGKDIKNHEIKELRGLDGVKKFQIKINNLTIKVAVVNGLLNAKNLLDQIQSGKKEYHFIEIMTCPGGCINGGGQPINVDKNNIKERMRGLYKIDRQDTLKFSHRNPMILDLYKNFLGKPLSEKSHKLLHTHYSKRKVVI